MCWLCAAATGVRNWYQMDGILPIVCQNGWNKENVLVSRFSCLFCVLRYTITFSGFSTIFLLFQISLRFAPKFHDVMNRYLHPGTCNGRSIYSYGRWLIKVIQGVIERCVYTFHVIIIGGIMIRGNAFWYSFQCDGDCLGCLHVHYLGSYACDLPGHWKAETSSTPSPVLSNTQFTICTWLSIEIMILPDTVICNLRGVDNFARYLFSTLAVHHCNSCQITQQKIIGSQKFNLNKNHTTNWNTTTWH